jgi:hypothetical protein
MPNHHIPFPEQILANPWTPLNWRWQRAYELVTGGEYYSKKRDDAETGVAVAYLRDLNKSATTYWQRKVRDKFRHVAAAAEMFNSWSLQRLEVECRILARQSDVAIGDLMDMPPETLQAYHDLFFAVRPALEAQLFSHDRAIEAFPCGPAEWRFAKRDAYHLGPGMIPMWIAYLRVKAGVTGAKLDPHDLARVDFRLARHEFADDDSISEWLIDHPEILLDSMAEADFPRSISSQMQDWGSARRHSASLPTENLRPCSYAPPHSSAGSPRRCHNAE